ncbi:MAG: aminopeptidase P family protein [Phycisphaerales bacterium]|nr:aminopeptidase P family protein [Phycisphaerales bacterium]
MSTRKTPSPPHDGRIARLRAAMTSAKLDGYLVQDRMDQIWLTGFTGESGSVLVTHRGVTLLTDGRFDETADIEAPWARKLLRKKRSIDETARELRRAKVTRLGIDPDQTTLRTFTELQKAAKPIRITAASRIIADLRLTKDAGEIALIRRAIEVAEAAFKKVTASVRVGMKERDVAADLVYEMSRRGAQGPAFAPIVATGASASLPHYEAGDREIRADACLLIDWGARVDWYVSDLTRMVWPGSIPPRLREVHKIVREAHDRAIAVIKPGILAAQVDKAARDYITKSGYGANFNHSVGHGIGLNVHESPGLRRQSKESLRPGMVVTIEPGIYLPGVGGIRIEDDVLVTDSGHEVLSSLPTGLSN